QYDLVNQRHEDDRADIAKPVRKLVSIETLKVASLKRRNGTMGLSVRCSSTKKRTSMTADPISRPSTSGEVQAWSLVMESATIRGIKPATSAAAPGKSMSRTDALERTKSRIETA